MPPLRFLLDPSRWIVIPGPTLEISSTVGKLPISATSTEAVANLQLCNMLPSGYDQQFAMERSTMLLIGKSCISMGHLIYTMAMLNNQRVSLVSGFTRYLTSQQLKKIRTLSILQWWCSIKRQQTSQHAQGKGSIRKMVWQKT